MNNLNITLKLYGGLDKYIKNYDYKKGAFLRLDSNEKVTDIVRKLGIPKHKITIIIAKDKIIDLDYIVKNNDLIKIFSYIGGG